MNWLPDVLYVSGLACSLYGAFLLWGLPVTLIIGGIVLIVTALFAQQTREMRRTAHIPTGRPPTQ